MQPIYSFRLDETSFSSSSEILTDGDLLLIGVDRVGGNFEVELLVGREGRSRD